jgi:hypothetical protein
MEAVAQGHAVVQGFSHLAESSQKFPDRMKSFLPGVRNLSMGSRFMQGFARVNYLYGFLGQQKPIGKSQIRFSPRLEPSARLRSEPSSLRLALNCSASTPQTTRLSSIGAPEQ